MLDPLIQNPTPWQAAIDRSIARDRTIETVAIHDAAGNTVLAARFLADPGPGAVPAALRDRELALCRLICDAVNAAHPPA